MNAACLKMERPPVETEGLLAVLCCAVLRYASFAWLRCASLGSAMLSCASLCFACFAWLGFAPLGCATLCLALPALLCWAAPRSAWLRLACFAELSCAKPCLAKLSLDHPHDNPRSQSQVVLAGAVL
jgi:hypothetical protein